MIRRTFIAVTFLCLLASSVSATDVADYQKRVRSARAGVQELLSNPADEDVGDEPAQPTEEIFAQVLALIPATEGIETGSGSVETNNKWFADGLKAAEEEKDPAKRAEMLSKIDGRLASLSVELEEMQHAAAAELSKDEEKRKLAEILDRPEYQRPEKKEQQSEDSLLMKWLREFLQWLESWLPAPGGTEPANLSGAVSAVQYLLIGLIIILFGFLAYKLVPLFAQRFRGIRKEAKESRVILGEKIDDDVSASELFSDAERLAREGDLRGAIRRGYVALLCEMSDRKLIGLARHKTNRDYLRDVRTRREIYERMNGLTGSFELHWYGSREAEQQDWEEFRRTCGETIKAI